MSCLYIHCKQEAAVCLTFIALYELMMWAIMNRMALLLSCCCCSGGVTRIISRTWLLLRCQDHVSCTQAEAEVGAGAGACHLGVVLCS